MTQLLLHLDGLRDPQRSVRVHTRLCVEVMTLRARLAARERKIAELQKQIERRAPGWAESAPRMR